MTTRDHNYKKMDQFMTNALIADGVLFLLYLIFAICGVIWLKVILALCVILISGGSLALLYINKELLHRRSLWMTVAACSAIICLLFSLILNFPEQKLRTLCGVFIIYKSCFHQ